MRKSILSGNSKRAKANNGEKASVNNNSNGDANSNHTDRSDSSYRMASRDATIYTDILRRVAERQRLRRAEQQHQSGSKQENTDTSQNG